jgi:ubiquitin-conjugating enzyme E2 R
MSIVSLLSDPNVNSPANVDAAVMWRKDREAYDKRVAEDVARSRLHLPKDFRMPEAGSAYVAPKVMERKEEHVADDFWYESADSDDECLMEDDDDGSDNAEFDDDED